MNIVNTREIVVVQVQAMFKLGGGRGPSSAPIPMDSVGRSCPCGSLLLPFTMTTATPWPLFSTSTHKTTHLAVDIPAPQ